MISIYFLFFFYTFFIFYRLIVQHYITTEVTTKINFFDYYTISQWMRIIIRSITNIISIRYAKFILNWNSKFLFPLLLDFPSISSRISNRYDTLPCLSNRKMTLLTVNVIQVILSVLCHGSKFSPSSWSV